MFIGHSPLCSPLADLVDMHGHRCVAITGDRSAAKALGEIAPADILAPSVSRVAFLDNPVNPGTATQLRRALQSLVQRAEPLLLQPDGEVHAVSERIDAALPFLSFAAGAMAAAEILKLGLPGYPFAPNRVVLNTQPATRTLRAALSLRPHYICQRRSTTVHRQMTRFSAHGLEGAAIVRS